MVYSPSGTEDIYKIYAESFPGEGHLRRIEQEAVTIVNGAFAAAGLRSGQKAEPDTTRHILWPLFH